MDNLDIVRVAQLVEHRTHKPKVVGSIPTPDTAVFLSVKLAKSQFYVRLFLMQT